MAASKVLITIKHNKICVHLQVKNLLQWNLWIAETYGSLKICPLLRGVR